MKKKKKKKKLEYCYFCGDLATTKDHIPPKCLFSEKLENGENLITVPSCTKHNNDRSSIDYQMLFYLSAVDPNTSRQMNALPNLMNKMMPKDNIRKCISAIMEINKWVETPIFTNIDEENKTYEFSDVATKQHIKLNKPVHRIYQESILRGFFYEIFRKRHDGKIFIMPHSLMWPFESILNDEEKAAKESFSTVFQSIQFDKFQEYISSESTDYVYDFKYFYHEKLDVKIIHVCLFKWYYFTGFFCNDERFEMLCNMFKESDPIIDFNLYIKY